MTLKNTLPRDDRATVKTEPAITLPALLTECEAAAYIGVSVSYLRQARTKGAPGGRTAGPNFVRLDSFGLRDGKNGGRVMYPRADLDKWLMSLERKRVI